MPKFQVYKDSAGKFRFRLRADNNKIIAAGEAYEHYTGCIKGIKSIQKNSNAPIEDTTVEGERFSNPKFQIYRDNTGKFRFHLNARNGEIIVESSEGYETKDACLNGINVVGQSANAEIKVQTESEEPTEAKTQDIAPTTSETNASQSFEMSKTEGSIAGLSANAEIKDLTGPEKNEAGNVEGRATALTTEKNVSQNSELSKTEGKTMDKEDEILAELKKISAALEKAPPPVPPKGLWNEFKDFLSKYKIFGLAIAFIIGLYLGILVQALVKDLLLPAIGLLIPGMNNLATTTVGVFAVGDFLVALITFLIVALIAFIAVKVVKKWNIE